MTRLTQTQKCNVTESCTYFAPWKRLHVNCEKHALRTKIYGNYSDVKIIMFVLGKIN